MKHPLKTILLGYSLMAVGFGYASYRDLDELNREPKKSEIFGLIVSGIGYGIFGIGMYRERKDNDI